MKPLYERYEKDYGKHDPRDEERLNKCLTFIRSEKPKKRLLDVGCGNGSFAERIKESLPNVEIYGIDISEKAVSFAKKKGIIARMGDLNEFIPFDDGFFDLVFCGEVIEHLIDPDVALKEINRVLKRRGTLILSTPNLACWYNRILLLLGFQPAFTDVSNIDNTLGRKWISRIFKTPGCSGGHIHVFTYQAVRDMLSLHGFEIQDVQSASSAQIFTSNKFVLFLDRIFSFFPSLASDVIIKVRKK